jgi:hypothetical protein
MGNALVLVEPPEIIDVVLSQVIAAIGCSGAPMVIPGRNDTHMVSALHLRPPGMIHA